MTNRFPHKMPDESINRLMDVFTAASELIAYEYDVFGVDGHIITEDVKDRQWVALYNELKAAVIGGGKDNEKR